MFWKHRGIGLDIGTESIKLTYLDSDRGLIENKWSCPILPLRISKDDIPTKEDIQRCIGDVIRECQKEVQSFKRHVSASIQGGGSITKYIELPLLKPKELAVAVPSAAIRHIPFPMEKITLSFIQMPQISTKEKKTGIFFIAEQNEFIENLKGIINASGLELNRLETPSLPLTRLFGKNHRMPRESFHAIVHTGFKFTHVIVFRDRYPYFAREFALGGRDFTYAFQMGYQISWKEAEEKKAGYDALQREIGIEPFFARWLDEIKKSLTFFAKSFNTEDLTVHKVFLSGGGAAMINIDKRLEEHLGIPVQIDSLEHIKFKNPQSRDLFHGTYAVATGLALEN
ncbi:MAG: pilus assembly protein PilM [Vulcanimicrobiota bacterium]